MSRERRGCDYCFDSLSSKSQILYGQQTAYRAVLKAPRYNVDSDLAPEERLMNMVPEYPVKRREWVSAHLTGLVNDLLSLELL